MLDTGLDLGNEARACQICPFFPQWKPLGSINVLLGVQHVSFRAAKVSAVLIDQSRDTSSHSRTNPAAGCI